MCRGQKSKILFKVLFLQSASPYGLSLGTYTLHIAN